MFVTKVVSYKLPMLRHRPCWAGLPDLSQITIMIVVVMLLIA